MPTIRQSLLFLPFLSLSTTVLAQDKIIQEVRKDTLTVPQKIALFAAKKFAAVRPLNVEYTYVSPYKFTAENGGSKSRHNKVERLSIFEATSKFNLLEKKKWLLSTALAYRNISTEVSFIDPLDQSVKNVNEDYHYFSGNLNLSYFSQLFGRRIIYTSSIMVDGSEKNLERIRGLFLGTMILKANEKTKMTVGILANIDPSIQIPVLPTFGLEHKFNNGLMADIAIPRYLYLRKHVTSSSRVSLGTEIDRTSFYLYNIDNTPQRYEYRQIDLNSGLVYEHLLGKYFILTAKTGLKSTVIGRMFKKEDRFNEPVFENRPDASYYANIGISFNPMALFRKSINK
ncbi:MULTISPECIES: DUF6268 family outer membrane beta-barrel protein [Bacteroidota]|uniref:DUF6268 family outer membrane beta-barrel protein n=1 Tax=Bacteroidota TaxID=976 RepID=UPI00241D76AB|nr:MULTISPECIES: DUF6268 family outer membrane beta-barrel protein [Bacteroidota]